MLSKRQIFNPTVRTSRPAVGAGVGLSARQSTGENSFGRLRRLPVLGQPPNLFNLVTLVTSRSLDSYNCAFGLAYQCSRER